MSERPLSLLLRLGDEVAPFAQLSADAQDAWWRRTLPAALIDASGADGRLLGVWRSSWSSDWHYFAAYEFASLEALERAVDVLGEARLFRHLATSRLLGQRWGGEPGWDADKWTVAERHPPLGGVLFYRISESLYTLTDAEMTARHDRRRGLLDAAIAELMRRGGQRLGSYFCEWSSEWHLYVLYEFPDLDALATFNRDLPERHGSIDYDLVYLLGRRLADPSTIRRP